MSLKWLWWFFDLLDEPTKFHQWFRYSISMFFIRFWRHLRANNCHKSLRRLKYQAKYYFGSPRILRLWLKYLWIVRLLRATGGVPAFWPAHVKWPILAKTKNQTLCRINKQAPFFYWSHSLGMDWAAQFDVASNFKDIWGLIMGMIQNSEWVWNGNGYFIIHQLTPHIFRSLLLFISDFTLDRKQR